MQRGVRETKDSRVFFALWPHEALRERLNRAAKTIPVECPSRRVPRVNLHLTLHFIGNVYFDQLACLQRQARRVKTDTFELGIDRQAIFSKPRVAWLGCNEIPAALTGLHQLLGQQLGLCDYQPEARHYNPHVTVARKIGYIPETCKFESITWQVREFVLVEVRQVDKGVQYRVVETYPLT